MPTTVRNTIVGVESFIVTMEESMQATNTIEADQRDQVFRKFQLEKFDPRHAVPAVSMTVNADITAVQAIRRTRNEDSPWPTGFP